MSEHEFNNYNGNQEEYDPAAYNPYANENKPATNAPAGTESAAPYSTTDSTTAERTEMGSTAANEPAYTTQGAALAQGNDTYQGSPYVRPSYGYGNDSQSGSSNTGSNPYAANSYNANSNPYSSSGSSTNPYSTNTANATGSNPYAQGPSGSNPQTASGSVPPRQPAQPKKAKQKKAGKSSFGKNLLKCVAYALVFGLVAGSAFSGVTYVSNKFTGSSKSSMRAIEKEADASDAEEKEETSKESTISSTATGYAADLTDVSSIVEEVMPCIVAITNTAVYTYQNFWGQSGSYTADSCGSGFIIDEDDEYLYIATNNHVVANADSLSVQFCDEATVDAETLGTYATKDLAVVRVKLSDIESDTLSAIKVATIGDSSVIKVGEPAIAIGNALGYGQSVTTGIVSALGRSITTQDSTTGETTTNSNLIQTDAAINPGNSGGALLNENGEVIGINSAKYSSTDVEGIGYAIPMEDALPILQEIIETGSYVDMQKAYLGIAGADVTSDIASAYNMPTGVYISSVYENSGAANAGLKKGDIITAIEDTEVSSMDELKAALANYSAGDTITISVYRSQGNEYKGYYVSVTLTSAAELQTEQK